MAPGSEDRLVSGPVSCHRTPVCVSGRIEMTWTRPSERAAAGAAPQPAVHSAPRTPFRVGRKGCM
eukprot:scaffold8473_cov141-Isochrysis_galbana.AAC.2